MLLLRSNSTIGDLWRARELLETELGVAAIRAGERAWTGLGTAGTFRRLPRYMCMVLRKVHLPFVAAVALGVLACSSRAARPSGSAALRCSKVWRCHR